MTPSRNERDPRASADHAGLDDTVNVVEAALTDLFRLAGSRRVHADRQRRSGTELTRTEWEVLRRVDDLGPVRVRRVAELVGLSPAVTSRALTSLEASGYVRRASTPEDGRGVSLQATTSGRRARSRFQRAMFDELANVLSEWTADDRARLAEVLPRLVADLRDGGVRPGTDGSIR